MPEPALPAGQKQAACDNIGAVCEPELVLEGAGSPFVLRANGTGLFFRDSDNLQRVELSTSAPSSARSGISGLIYFDITTDQTLYYAQSSPGQVLRGELSTPSTDQVLATGTMFYGFVIAGGALWQGSTTDTLRIPLDGSAVQTVSGAPCVDLVADATHIYCRAGGNANGVIRIDQTTLTVEVLQPVPTALGDVEVTPRYAYSVPDLIDVGAPRGVTLTRIDKATLTILDYDFAGSGNTLASDAAGVYVSVAEPGDGPVIYYLADDTDTAVPGSSTALVTTVASTAASACPRRTFTSATTSTGNPARARSTARRAAVAHSWRLLLNEGLLAEQRPASRSYRTNNKGWVEQCQKQ